MAEATPTERAWQRENDFAVSQKQREYQDRQAANLSASRPPSFGVGQMDGLSGQSPARQAAADNTNPGENIRSIPAALQAAREKQRQLAGTTATPTAAVTNLINTQYETWFNTFQSGFIGPIFAFDLLVSAPIFVCLYFLRIIVGLIKLKLKDVYVLPPYRLTSMGGIAVTLTHTGVTLYVLLIYALVLLLVILIVYFITQPWELVLLTFGNGFSGLKSLYDALQ